MSVFTIIWMYAVWASVFSLAKNALQYTGPLFLTGLRMLLGGGILLGYLSWMRKSSLPIKKKEWISIACLGFFSMYLTNVLESWGLQYLTAAKACFIYSLSPFFAALFSYFHFGEKLNWQKAVGLGVGFLGILPVIAMQSGAEEIRHAFSIFSWPALAMVGASACSVYGWVILRLIVKEQTLSPILANGTSMVLGGTIAVVHSFLYESWNPSPVVPGGVIPLLGWITLITLVSNVLCYNLYGMLLKKFTATLLSFIGLLSPIFASLHGTLFLGEPLSWLIVLSTGVVSLGLWIVYSAELRQGYTRIPS